MTSPAVVDTDVVSFQFKRDPRAGLYVRHLSGRERLLVTFMTVAELDRWAKSRRWGPARVAKLERHLAAFVPVYADRELCRWWAEAKGRADRNGQPVPDADAWMAALALCYDVPLVTHNPADYTGVDGLTVLTEASP